MNSLIDPCLATAPAAAFALGGQEMLVILFLLAIPVGVLVLVLAIVKGTRHRNAPPPLDVQARTEARLTEIDSMLAAGTITEAEHAAQRKRILDSL